LIPKEEIMSASRSIAEWTTDKYEAAVDLARRMTDYIKANEPDTLIFEWFGNEETGRVLWYQEYRDDEAFLTHVQNMADQGFREETLQVLALDRVVLLTPANHPTVKEMAQQPGFVKLQGIARVVR
jgi:quinol monooxygenase YgiN